MAEAPTAQDRTEKEKAVDEDDAKRLLRTEKKRLRKIVELANKVAAGEKLNEDQESKLSRRAEVEALVAKLEARCSI